MQSLSCRFHPTALLVEDSRAGDVICMECGLVVGDRMIDVSSEWRTFNDDTNGVNQCRVGGVQDPLWDGNNLSTAMTQKIDTRKNKGDELKQLKHQPPQISSADKALKDGFVSIRVMADRISLSKKVITSACYLFKQCYEKKCTRGRSHDAIVATCIYIACRNDNEPRTIKEICAISNSSKIDIGRIVSWMQKHLTVSKRCDTMEIKNLLPRFCSRLTLLDEKLIQKTSIHIAERAKELCDIQSRAPDSIAGASIYMACAAVGESIPIKSIEVATGACESTIRTVYKIMLRQALFLFPTDFPFKCRPANLPKS